jgi:hypothetical protein
MKQTGIGELLAQAFQLFRRNLLFVLALTVPVVVIVTGVTALGLGELGARYHASLPQRDLYIDLAANELVTAPLITSILARWVLLRSRGASVTAHDLVATALEAFPFTLLVIVAWLVAVVLAGSLFILPGIYLLVSWYFVVQAVVIDGDRGFAPIIRSAGYVRRRWWRTAGLLLALQLGAAIPAELIVLIFTSLARSANAEAIVVLGNIVGFALTLPFQAIGTTLYYLQIREAAAQAGRP